MPDGNVLVTNIFPSGNFESDVGWSMENASFSVNENIGTLLASGQNGFARKRVDWIEGHILYFRVWMKSTVNYAYLTIPGKLIKHYPGDGDWEVVSGRATMAGAYGYFAIRDQRGSAWDNIYVKNAVIIDLTQDFCSGVIGTGKEPTVAEMDMMIADYEVKNSYLSGSGLVSVASRLNNKTWAVKNGEYGYQGIPEIAPTALAGKTIVQFGDSIYGNARPPRDISTEISYLTGATVYNCGFGGCLMSQRSWDDFGAFSMHALADAITTGNWTAQDAAVAGGTITLDYEEETVALLKSIDFTKVDIITIGYGSNDIPFDKQIDNGENLTDISTALGALRYSIQTILAVFPQIRIFVISPTWRFWFDENSEYDYSSDERIFTSTETFPDFITKEKECCKLLHVPFIDMYNEFVFNAYTRTVYFSGLDGTHPNFVGRKLMARKISHELY